MGRSQLLGLACLALAGACMGPTYDTSTKVPFEPVSPAIYVAKVKNILVGMAPTDAEVAAVVADPTALPGLIDTWMTLPQYDEKMTVFFELAFQQTQITAVDFVDIIPNNGLGNGQAIPLLVQDARESFARTVVAATSGGAPLTSAFTSKQLMMTPALMQLYAFLDARRVDDNTKIFDDLVKAYPGTTFTIEAAQGPIPIAQSIDPTSPNFMHFYNPEILTQVYPDPTCNMLDPIQVTVNSSSLLSIMYGEIPAHLGPNSVACPIKAGTSKGMQLAPTDFTTWKLVTMRPPQGPETSTTFYDLPTLRGASELVLRTPRPGFFTTPAFFANWPTNKSNQMRVTANQALIVATGTAIDGTDATTPATTPGLDMTHAAPGSSCFGCHQLLDPTRSILSSTYSWFYNPQTDPTLIAQPGQFAFQNVIAPVASIDDFAKLLATHPLVPQAWVQKLCYYVNSAPCDPLDPELQRIVGDFANGFTWNALVKDLLASPITTNATETRTHDTNGEVIAVARRDHLCATLNNRLGFVDICQLDAANQAKLGTIAQIVSGMPSDGYGRGATIPVLPNQPTLFYISGLQSLCATIATQVIDAAVDPNQPGAKHWSSAQPDAAIADFVGILMALTPSDPRSARATTVLKSHFVNTSEQQGLSASDAMRSTFMAACMSPSFIGIGM